MAAAMILSLLLAAAPPRSPAEQARLTALASALGRAHALHRLCAGPADDLWRSRVGKVLDGEKPDPAFRQRLTDSFNAGFEAGTAAFTACSPQSREALADAEHTAAEQARRLASPG